MLTVNWFLQECTRLQSCTIGIRIHVYDQSRLNSFHSGHDPLTKQDDVLPVLTSENPCFGFTLRLLKTCAQFKIAFWMWNLTLTLTLTHHLNPKLWINDPDGITLRKPTLTAFKILLILFRRPGTIIASPTILITSKPPTWVKLLFALRFRLMIFITLTKLKDGFYITRMRTTCHHRAICKKKL